jgi:hypothetical protein
VLGFVFVFLIVVFSLSAAMHHIINPELELAERHIEIRLGGLLRFKDLFLHRTDFGLREGEQRLRELLERQALGGLLLPILLLQRGRSC